MKTKLFYGIFIVLSMWGLYSCKQAEKPIKFGSSDISSDERKNI